MAAAQPQMEPPLPAATEEPARTDLRLRIPVVACTLDGFRAWAVSDDFPRQGRISFLDKEIVIDMSPERLQAHGMVKNEVARVISTLNIERDLGVFCPDRTLITNVTVALSTEPDAAFVTWKSLESGRVQLVPCKVDDQDYVELAGTPDWVCEVLSDSSATDDTRLMRELYHRAGVPEYWLIDARRDEMVFQILHRRASGYVAAPRREGWQKSRVFGYSFRWERRRSRMNLWRYQLLVHPS